MTVLYSQNFDSETVGTLPAGWVNKVGTWQVAAAGAVSGANALKSTTFGANDVVLYTGHAAMADMSIRTYGKAVLVSGRYPQISHVLRSDADYNNCYVVYLAVINGTTCSIQFYRRTGGSSSLMVNNAGISLPLSDGDTIGFETRIEAGIMEARVWNATTGSRPAAYSATRGDTTITAAGYPGLFNQKDGVLSYPAADDFTLSDLAEAASSIAMIGPATCIAGTPSSDFTVSAGSIASDTIVTPSDSGAGGTFLPTSVTLTSGTLSRTFKYTASSAGSKSISVTNDGGLTNPAPISVTASAATIYDRVDATDYKTGQAIMVLVPNALASVPYNAANPTNVVLYSHGSGEDQAALVSDSKKSATLTALLNAGYIVAGTAAHGPSNWGNQLSVDDLAALDQYVRANYNVGKVALWGQSMGGLSALSAVAQGKINVTGALLTYPVCSLSSMTSGAFSTALNTAHGVTGSGIYTYANQTNGMDPVLKPASAYRDVPMRFYASAGDTVVVKATNTDALVSTVSGSRIECDVVVCTGDHGDPSHFIPADYAAFFNRCFRSRSNTVTITLRDESGSPMPSLSGIRWIVRHRAALGKSMPPIAQGTGETTDASGVLSLTFTAALSIGDVVDLEITTSDGSPTQSPSPRGWSGPVEVA